MNRLFYISLALSIAGIFILILISLNVQPQKISLSSELRENSYVSISGRIVSIKTFPDSGGFSIIKLENNMTVICNCNFPVNTTVAVIGRVEEYENNLQINAEKINSLPPQ
jgi:hypothetical protein